MQLTTLPENFFLNQKELTDLLLAQNRINFLPSNVFRPLVKLGVLYLNKNRLQSINPEWFVSLQNLKTLNFAENQILKIPSKCFASLTNLKYLYLHENKIKTLNSDNFDGLQNLQTISLSDNEISDLPVAVFTPLKNLQKLWLNNNILITIHSDSFGIHNQLKEIYIGDNKINAIDERFIDNTAVSSLNMTSNICIQQEFRKKSINEIKPNLKKCFDNYQARTMQANSCGKGLKAVNTIIGGTEIKRGMYPW